MYEYNATLRRVVDGDTLDLTLDLGLSVMVNERVRLFGVDTPEIHGVKRGSDEWERGKSAMAYVEEALLNCTGIKVETVKDRKGKYGRYLAVVYFKRHDKWYCLNKMLVICQIAEPDENFSKIG